MKLYYESVYYETVLWNIEHNPVKTNHLTTRIECTIMWNIEHNPVKTNQTIRMLRYTWLGYFNQDETAPLWVIGKTS